MVDLNIVGSFQGDKLHTNQNNVWFIFRTYFQTCLCGSSKRSSLLGDAVHFALPWKVSRSNHSRVSCFVGPLPFRKEGYTFSCIYMPINFKIMKNDFPVVGNFLLFNAIKHQTCHHPLVRPKWQWNMAIQTAPCTNQKTIKTPIAIFFGPLLLFLSKYTSGMTTYTLAYIYLHNKHTNVHNTDKQSLKSMTLWNSFLFLKSIHGFHFWNNVVSRSDGPNFCTELKTRWCVPRAYAHTS